MLVTEPTRSQTESAVVQIDAIARPSSQLSYGFLENTKLKKQKKKLKCPDSS